MAVRNDQIVTPYQPSMRSVAGARGLRLTVDQRVLMFNSVLGGLMGSSLGQELDSGPTPTRVLAGSGVSGATGDCAWALWPQRLAHDWCNFKTGRIWTIGPWPHDYNGFPQFCELTTSVYATSGNLRGRNG